MRLGILSPDKIEHDRRPALIRLAPRVAHIHNVQQPAHADRLSFEWLIGRCLLGLLHQLGHALGFLIRVVAGQRFAVLLHCPLNQVPVHKKVVVLFRLGLGHMAV